MISPKGKMCAAFLALAFALAAMSSPAQAKEELIAVPELEDNKTVAEAAADELPDPPAARSLEITLVNKTDAKIFVAFKFPVERVNDSAFDPGYVHGTKGWWGVAPGETKTVRPCRYYDHNLKVGHTVYYYYATSKGGKRIWSGKEGDPTHAIHPKDPFDFVMDEGTPGSKDVKFRPMKVKDGKGALSFALKQ